MCVFVFTDPLFYPKTFQALPTSTSIPRGLPKAAGIRSSSSNRNFTGGGADSDSEEDLESTPVVSRPGTGDGQQQQIEGGGGNNEVPTAPLQTEGKNKSRKEKTNNQSRHSEF